MAGWVWRSLLVLVLLCGPATATGQDILERAAGLDVRDEPLESALRLLQRAARISLAFSPDLLPRDHRVSCPCVGVTVAQALRRILAGTDLDFVTTGGVITIGPARGSSADIGPGAIAGRAVDSEGGAPVMNALVQLEDGPGTITGHDGSFLIGEVTPGNHRLNVTALGWKLESAVQAAVVAAETTSVRMALVRQAVPIQGIVVEPGQFGLLEGVVSGTERTLTRHEIQTIPQVGEDVFRTMTRLPGVASSDISAKLEIRGGADREGLVRLDGLELYEPYHVLDWDGALGIVDINVLGGVELQTGGFGVQHGDKLTGVFDLTSRRPEGDAKTTLGLSISNLTAMSRGTFDVGRGAWLLSARRGFLDLVMDLANEGRRLSPKYSDVFAKVRYELGSVHRLSARFLYAHDGFLLRDPDIVNLDEVDFESAWDSKYGWLSWEVFPSSGFSATTIAWVGAMGRQREGAVHDSSDTPLRASVSDNRDFSFAGIRSDVSFRLSELAVLEVGAEGKLLGVDYRYSRQTWTPFVTSDNTRGIHLDTLDVVLSPDGYEMAAYAALRVRPAKRLTAEVGLRHDAVSHTGENNLSPRLSAAIEISPRANLRVSAGRYFQSHGLHELDVGDGEESYFPSEQADQVALGLDHKLPGNVALRLEFYRRTMSERRPTFMNVEQELKIFPEAAGDRIRIDADRGRARGMEVSIERKSGDSWSWSASYVWAIAEDRVEGSWITRQFDQRHTVLIRTAFEPDARWNISLGWRFHSGWPATSWSWIVQPLDDGWNFWTREFGQLRSLRLPAYHRLDVRISRTFTFTGRRTLQVFLDLFNVYNRTNLGSWDYSGTYRNGNLTVQRLNGQEMLPFLPTFGLRYEF